jgi:hypothetical protein
LGLVNSVNIRMIFREALKIKDNLRDNTDVKKKLLRSECQFDRFRGAMGLAWRARPFNWIDELSNH